MVYLVIASVCDRGVSDNVDLSSVTLKSKLCGQGYCMFFIAEMLYESINTNCLPIRIYKWKIHREELMLNITVKTSELASDS